MHAIEYDMNIRKSNRQIYIFAILLTSLFSSTNSVAKSNFVKEIACKISFSLKSETAPFNHGSKSHRGTSDYHNVANLKIYPESSLYGQIYGQKGIFEHRIFSENEKQIMPKAFKNRYDIAISNEMNSPVFVTAGKNTTETLKHVNSISGISIKDLNTLAKPRGGTTGQPHTSDVGYISKKQNIRDVLIKDNETVVDQFGLSHQKVAEPILDIIKKVNQHFEKDFNDIAGIGVFNKSRSDRNFPTPPRSKLVFIVKNQKYEIEVLEPFGKNPLTRESYESAWMPGNTQGSIFGDNIFTNYALRIKNSRGEIIEIDTITPHMIFRYGFYQGGEYRISPEQLIQFFTISLTAGN